MTAQYVDDTDGFNELNAETPTLQLEISVDASVPKGTYPINIAGYNGDKKEEMTFNLVVGDSGQSAGANLPAAGHDSVKSPARAGLTNKNEESAPVLLIEWQYRCAFLSGQGYISIVNFARFRRQSRALSRK